MEASRRVVAMCGGVHIQDERDLCFLYNGAPCKIKKNKGWITELVVSNERDLPMGLLSDTLNSGLRMRRACREQFPHHRNLTSLRAPFSVTLKMSLQSYNYNDFQVT